MEGGHGKEVLWTNNPLLVKAFRELFELKWNNGLTEYPKKNNS
jgi:hypothetical protein